MAEKSDREVYLKVYELYVQRISKEGDWYWSRFRIYLSLNTGLFLALSFLFKEEIKALELVPFTAAILIAIIGIVGLYLSNAWRVVQKMVQSGRGLFMNVLPELRPRCSSKR